MCLTGSLPFSNYWLCSLAAGFRFHLYSMCIPCPWNFKIGRCANEKPLGLIAHRRVRFFTFMFVSTSGIGGRGGTHWIQFKLRKILWFWRDLMTVPPQCQHDIEKTVYDLWFWHDDAWRESRASLVEEWNFMLTYTSVVRASVEGLAGTFIGKSFFGAAAFLFGLDSLCLFRWKPFLVSISGRPLLLFH